MSEIVSQTEKAELFVANLNPTDAYDVLFANSFPSKLRIVLYIQCHKALFYSLCGSLRKFERNTWIISEMKWKEGF